MSGQKHLGIHCQCCFRRRRPWGSFQGNSIAAIAAECCALVARNTFSSKKCQNTWCSDHFLTIRWPLDVEKVHTVVARGTFPRKKNQKLKSFGTLFDDSNCNMYNKNNYKHNNYNADNNYINYNTYNNYKKCNMTIKTTTTTATTTTTTSITTATTTTTTIVQQVQIQEPKQLQQQQQQ